MNINRIIRKALIKSSGIILLVIILLKLDTKNILRDLANLDLLAISPLFLLFLAFSYVKTKRWEVLLNNSRVNVTGKNLFVIYVASFLIGAVTPGRIGEVFKYKMLRCKALDNDLGFVLSVQDRIWDLSLVFLIGTVFLLSVLDNMMYLVLFLPGLITLFSIAMYPEWFMKYTSRFFLRILPDVGFTKKVLTLSKNLLRLSIKDQIQCLMFTILSWFIYFSQVYLLFSATGLHYNFIFISCVIAAAGLVALLPISIAGIGTRDMALVGLFSLSGKSPEVAIVLSACVLGIFLANCLISFPFWMYASHAYTTSHFCNYKES